jgi:RimJ/RimL family protein N-acetyltransferase
MGPVLRTERLILRPWRDEDLPAFVALNADPEVMAHNGGPRTRVRSEGAAREVRQHFADHGFGLWAVELPGTASFIGFIGLAVSDLEAPFTPCIEIGWRLARAHWGRGYATEGARASLDFGFRELGLDQILSYTAAMNLRSQRVMEKIGMTCNHAEDFDFPRVPEGHPHRRSVLYRITRETWANPAGS